MRRVTAPLVRPVRRAISPAGRGPSAIERLAAQSRFGGGRIHLSGIGFDLRLIKV